MDEVDHIPDHIVDEYGLERQRRPPCVDPGQVEDLVDQADQMPAGGEDLPD